MPGDGTDRSHLEHAIDAIAVLPHLSGDSRNSGFRCSTVRPRRDAPSLKENTPPPTDPESSLTVSSTLSQVSGTNAAS
jgi:hypothetical protein